VSELIYICGDNTSGTPMVWTWDGTTLTSLGFSPGSGSFARCLYYYQGSIYVGTDDAKIHRYDGAWHYDVAQALDARDVATIMRYDDGVNGELWWILQGDRPDHVGGIGGISLWYGSDLTSLTKVTSLPAWMARGLCMMEAGGFLAVITHSDGRAYINSNGGLTAVDATVGANWTDSGFTNAGAPNHACLLAYADIGGLGSRWYYIKNTSSMAAYKTTITGGETTLGDGASSWAIHPMYGPHCYAVFLNRLYFLERRYSKVGYLDGASGYPEDADLHGGIAAATVDGEPCAFAVYKGDLHAIYRNGFNTKSFIERRVADTNWSTDLEEDPATFMDALVGPKMGRRLLYHTMIHPPGPCAW